MTTRVSRESMLQRLTVQLVDLALHGEPLRRWALSPGRETCSAKAHQSKHLCIDGLGLRRAHSLSLTGHLEGVSLRRAHSARYHECWPS